MRAVRRLESNLRLSQPRHRSQLTLGVLQLLQDRLLQALWLGGAGPSALDLAIPANQELLKVPLDPLHSKKTWLRLLQPIVQWARRVSVHVDLAHDGEGNAIVDQAEVLDVIVGAGLLGSELVAWEAEDLEFIAWEMLEGVWRNTEHNTNRASP